MQPPNSFSVIQVALKVPFAPYLDYLVPQSTTAPKIGARVLVPLGKSKKMVGMVVGLSAESQFENLKDIDAVLDDEPLINQSTLKLLKQAAKYYQVNLGEMIFTALPAWYRRTENRPIPIQYWWQAMADIKTAKDTLSNAPKQLEIFEYIFKHGPLQSKAMSHISSTASQICRQLEAKGLIDCAEVCFIDNDSAVDPGFDLTKDQANAYLQIHKQQNEFNIHLLDGVTGSGKTEIYIRLINDLLSAKKQALVLVPEIGLTPQLFQEISQRINGQMAILHSGLSDGARARVWQHATNGLVDVVVATRSGIFTPFKNLGGILVDEEHDLSYKQQEGVRYSARDLAVLRGKIENITVVLGSATPSFESLNHAMRGKYQWHKLRTRTNQNPMPNLTLQNTQAASFKSGLTVKTLNAIENHLADGNQVLVFLNRRGWSHKLICHECSWVAECDDCDAYLTYHMHLGLLKCHHCDRRYSVPEFCPECGSQDVETMGVGTEKVAHGLENNFSEHAIVRFDRDSVNTPTQWQKNLEIVRSGKPCVIVGTQMLSKGHDFPLLSLVVVVNVDNSFYSSDFRATEYLAQLLVQVSGRAGRAKTKGEVIIQTQFPEHEFFQMLFKENYESFAGKQLEERKAMLFPPFTHMAIIRGQHRNERVLDSFLQKLADGLEQNEDISIMGPIPAPMQKRQKLYRMQLILNSNDRRSLHKTIHQLKSRPVSKGEQQVTWFVDIDPVNFD